ncbi:hypothetical protein D3C72_2286010 [compost metagenome]
MILVFRCQKPDKVPLIIPGKLRTVHDYIQRLQRLVFLLKNMALIPRRHYIRDKQRLPATLKYNFDAVITNIQSRNLHQCSP